MESTSTVVQPGDQRETQTQTQSPRDQCQWKVRDPELPRRSQSETLAWGDSATIPCRVFPAGAGAGAGARATGWNGWRMGKAVVSRLPAADLAAASLPP